MTSVLYYLFACTLGCVPRPHPSPVWFPQAQVKFYFLLPVAVPNVPVVDGKQTSFRHSSLVLGEVLYLNIVIRLEELVVAVAFLSL